MPIVRLRLLAVTPRWDARLRSLSTNRLAIGVGVIAFIGDHRFSFKARNEMGELRTVSHLGSGQFQFQGVPQRVENTVDFTAEATATAAQRLGRLTATAVSFFFAPAAATLARTLLLSTLSHSVSSSRKAAAILAQTPFSHQRV